MVLTDVEQPWAADITDVRLREEFVFLAVILDAYSRRLIGWELDHTLGAKLTLAALRMALARRTVWRILPIVVCSMPAVTAPAC